MESHWITYEKNAYTRKAVLGEKTAPTSLRPLPRQQPTPKKAMNACHGRQEIRWLRRQKFFATLQVTDNQGGKGSTSVTITAIPKESASEVKMETGEVLVSSEWVRVPLTTPFANPVVIAGPPSFSNSEPCVIRLRNVNSTGFDIRLTEWNYQDGVHPQESVSYLVS